MVKKGPPKKSLDDVVVGFLALLVYFVIYVVLPISVIMVVVAALGWAWRLL